MTTVNDDDRYSWITDVIDAHGRPSRVRIGAENGWAIVDAPPWWKADPDTVDRIDLGMKAASNRARMQRRSRGQS